MEIIVPAAGLSTRFPSGKPKFMLYDYSGKSMLYRALEPFLGKYKITVGVLREHEDKYDVSDFIKHEFGSNINLVILQKRTRGPADTVSEILKVSSNSTQTPIFIKDCDSFFTHISGPGNYVCVSNLRNKSMIFQPAGKSFVMANENSLIQKIVEKQIVSDTYCVGGYKFESAHSFILGFESIKNVITGEIFISHVIKHLLSVDIPFYTSEVDGYTDAGTIEDWLDYNNKPVIFCDIDGTIIHNQQRYGSNNYYNDPVPLYKNIDAVMKSQNKGSQIIFTTARPDKYREVTEKMLRNLGFINFQLLMNLNNSSRILINDYNEMNPYPRATAINIKRNSDDLHNFL
jgi:hypothetical protein